MRPDDRTRIDVLRHEDSRRADEGHVVGPELRQAVAPREPWEVPGRIRVDLRVARVAGARELEAIEAASVEAARAAELEGRVGDDVECLAAVRVRSGRSARPAVRDGEGSVVLEAVQEILVR